MTRCVWIYWLAAYWDCLIEKRDFCLIDDTTQKERTMKYRFYEIKDAKAAAKALMKAYHCNNSDFAIFVSGSIYLNGDPVFGRIELTFDGKFWSADVDGKTYRESRFKFHPYTEFFLTGP